LQDASLRLTIIPLQLVNRNKLRAGDGVWDLIFLIYMT
jgi:hypothetical protein